MPININKLKTRNDLLAVFAFILFSISALIFLYAIYNSYSFTAESYIWSGNPSQDQLKLLDNVKYPAYVSIKADRGLNNNTIFKTPLYFEINTKKYPINKSLYISAIFNKTNNSANNIWTLNPFCLYCSNEEKKEAKAFYASILDNYKIIYSQNNSHIYIHNDNKNKFQDANSISEWLKQNNNLYQTVSILHSDFSASHFENDQPDYLNGSITSIDHKIRADHSYYTFAQDVLKLSINKQDLNWYEGLDGVIVNINNSDKTTICSSFIEDDGITTKDFTTPSPNINKKIECLLPKRGVYEIKFISADNDDKWIQDKKDWLISSLSVNTNKIILKDNIRPTDSGNIFMNFDLPAKINYMFDRNNRSDLILTNTDSKNQYILTTDNSLTSRLNNHKIKEGSYYVNYDSNTYISGGYGFFNKQNYFTPFQAFLNQSSMPDIIISDIYSQKTQNNKIKASIKIDLNSLNEKYFINKKLIFMIENNYIDKIHQLQYDISSYNFQHLKSMKDYDIYYNSSNTKIYPNINSQTSNAANFNNNICDLSLYAPWNINISDKSYNKIKNYIMDKNNSTCINYVDFAHQADYFIRQITPVFNIDKIIATIK